MKNEIEAILKSFGMPDVGYCAFSDVAEHLLDCRARQRIPENAKTVILTFFPYKVREEQPLNISRYAAVPDYHRVCLPMLEQAADALKLNFPDSRFEPFLDNSPIPEVYAAACAGLGVRGENGLLITPVYGSWVFIGEIVTDLEIPCENMLKTCSLCGTCKNACKGRVRGAKCLSAVSQQKNDLSGQEIAALRSNHIVWGCDMCAECCPMNRGAALTGIKAFLEGYRDRYTPGEDIKNRAYEWRGEKTVRRNFNLQDD